MREHALQGLAAARQLAACEHVGYWQCLDTRKDKKNLEREWKSERPPWKVWDGRDGRTAE
jgi:glucose-1-phosphate cytidylyltransferase